MYIKLILINIPHEYPNKIIPKEKDRQFTKEEMKCLVGMKKYSISLMIKEKQ